MIVYYTTEYEKNILFMGMQKYTMVIKMIKPTCRIVISLIRDRGVSKHSILFHKLGGR